MCFSSVKFILKIFFSLKKKYILENPVWDFIFSRKFYFLISKSHFCYLCLCRENFFCLLLLLLQFLFFLLPCSKPKFSPKKKREKKKGELKIFVIVVAWCSRVKKIAENHQLEKKNGNKTKSRIRSFLFFFHFFFCYFLIVMTMKHFYIFFFSLFIIFFLVVFVVVVYFKIEPVIYLFFYFLFFRYFSLVL